MPSIDMEKWNKVVDKWRKEQKEKIKLREELTGDPEWHQYTKKYVVHGTGSYEDFDTLEEVEEYYGHIPHSMSIGPFHVHGISCCCYATWDKIDEVLENESKILV